MRRLLLVVAALAAAMPAAAAPDVPKQKAIGKLPALETFTLPNGLQVAVLPSDALPIVSVQLWYRAGSKDEPRTARGTAHMFEHLMAQGTLRSRPDAFTQAVTAAGGYTGAATDEDATHFLTTVPTAYFDYAVRFEAERMRNLVLRKPAVDADRAVIRDEIAQQNGSPFTVGLARTMSIAFLKHPYAWAAVGNAREIEAITLDDLKKFYDTYYQPNNALLVIAGHVTAAEAKASAEKWFGPIAKAAEPPRPAPAEPEQTSRRREVVEPGVIGLAMVGWHTPAAKDKDSYPVQLASIILGTGEGARLKGRLKVADPKTKRPIALEAGTDAIIRADPGLVIALGAFVDQAQAEPIEAAIFDEVAKLAARGPSADELRKAKNQIQAGLVFSLETAQGIGEALGRSWILTGDPSQMLRDHDAIEKVSVGDVQRVAKQYLAADRATIVIVPPRAAPARPAAPAAASINPPPVPTAPVAKPATPPAAPAPAAAAPGKPQ